MTDRATTTHHHDLPGDERHTRLHPELLRTMQHVQGGQSLNSCPMWAIAHLYGTGRIATRRFAGTGRYVLTSRGERDLRAAPLAACA